MIAELPSIERLERVPTWFGIGGGAEAFARARDADDVRRLLAAYPDLRILGDGANLLVDDDGVAGLVVELKGIHHVRIDAPTGRIEAGAGASLPKLINASVQQGLAGLEVLAGFPATLGGALVMNAGGAHGQIADVVERVFALDRQGREVTLERQEIPFAYRSSGLESLVLLGAELRLTPSDPIALASRKREIMEFKKASQPLNANSAGCVWKNPTLGEDIAELGAKGTRVSAGLVIDRAGLKGLSIGGASISDRHANFVVTAKESKARDVIDLMRETRRRVFDRFGVTLLPEIVLWRRNAQGLDQE